MRLAAILILISLVTSLARPGTCDEDGSIEHLFQQLHLARLVRYLRFNETQLEALLKIAKSMDTERQKHIGKRDTPEVRAMLEQLRKAIVEDAPEDEIEMLHERLRELMGNEGERINAQSLLQLAARASAKEAVKILNPGQITRLVGEELDDPAGRLMALIRVARQQEEARAEANEFTNNIARLLSSDTKKEAALRRQLAEFRTRALALSKDEFTRQEKTLADEAQRIVQEAGGSSLNLLQLMAEGRLTEIMLNPHLTAVLEARLNYLKSK